jgi:hypothetical protein
VGHPTRQLPHQKGLASAEVAKGRVPPGLRVAPPSGRFSFIHQSVLERLVVRWGVSELLNERAPQQLARREMSALMVDFFAALAGRERIVSWVEGQLAEPSAPAASANALLVAKRLKISLAPARKELAGGI